MGFRLGALAVLCGAHGEPAPSSARADVTAPQTDYGPLDGDELWFGRSDRRSAGLQPVRSDPGGLAVGSSDPGLQFNQSISMTFTVPSTITVTAGSNMIAWSVPTRQRLSRLPPPISARRRLMASLRADHVSPNLQLRAGEQHRDLVARDPQFELRPDIVHWTRVDFLPLLASAISSFSSSSGNGFGQARPQAAPRCRSSTTTPPSRPRSFPSLPV